MKLFTSILLVVATVLPLSAQVSATLGGGQAERLAALEAPRSTVIASNASTAQIDFRQGIFQFTNGIAVGTQDYEVKQLANALTLNLTNLVPGVRRTVWIQADGTARTVAIVTNGITSLTRISYNAAIVTNGNYALSVTNRARVDLVARPTGEVFVNFTYSQ